MATATQTQATEDPGEEVSKVSEEGAQRSVSRERTPLQRAKERASDAGLVPCGQGRFRDGSRFWLVPSSSQGADTLYIVRSRGKGHLRCNCRASTYALVCAHIGAVVSAVTADTLRRERFAERIAQCVEADAATLLASGRAGSESGSGNDAYAAEAMQALYARSLVIAQKLDVTLAQAERRRAEARNEARLDESGSRLST